MIHKFKGWVSDLSQGKNLGWCGSLIALGIVVLIANPAGILAYAAIAYGAWTYLETQENNYILLISNYLMRLGSLLGVFPTSFSASNLRIPT